MRRPIILAGLAALAAVAVLGLVLVPGWRRRAAQTQRIAQQYGEIARCRDKYAPYAIPADGLQRCLEALRAPGGADRLYVRVAPDYEVILYLAPDHHDEQGRLIWNLSPNVLRVTRPAVDPSDGLDAQEAALLHHYYASQWIKDHPDGRVACSLLWIDAPRPLPDGGWSVESGMSQIAGDGLRSEIASDGSLIRIGRVFSPA